MPKSCGHIDCSCYIISFFETTSSAINMQKQFLTIFGVFKTHDDDGSVKLGLHGLTINLSMDK